MTDVELIKSKIDIVDFISNYVTLKKLGRNFKALCPFHTEKTPSFVVSPERQTWHCFGACSMGGDVITFYEKWEGVDFLDALKTLAEKTGVTLQKFKPSPDLLVKEKLYAINNLSVEFFHYLLTGHRFGERALDYLAKRKIKKEIIDNFQLGYAPESWNSLSNYLIKKGYSQTDLISAGLVVKSESGKIYDRFRGRLMFTLKDHRGKIIGFSGRTLPARPDDHRDEGGQAEKDPGAKYINSPETPLYIKGNVLYGLDVTKEVIKKEGFAIIVEGEFDFLASYQSGVSNIVAIKGSALTENQSLLLKRYAPEVSLALDSDFAGDQAARRGIEIAENTGLSVKVVTLLRGKDPADCILEGAHYWKKSVENALPVYDFIIESSLKKYDPGDVSGKKKIAEIAVPFLSKIQNPIIASHYIKKLAKVLNVTDESIEDSIDLFVKKIQVKSETINEYKTKKDRAELLEEHFLSLVLQSSNIGKALSQSGQIVTVEDFQVNPVKNIIGLLIGFMKKNSKFEMNLFNKLITPEIAPVFDRAYLLELGSLSADPKLLDAELEKTAKEVKKMSLRRTIGEISTKLSLLDDEGHAEEGKMLSEQIKENLENLKALDT